MALLHPLQFGIHRVENLWIHPPKIDDFCYVRVAKTGGRLQMLIFEKESEERGKREHFEGGGKRTPSLLNLAPTSA